MDPDVIMQRPGYWYQTWNSARTLVEEERVKAMFGSGQQKTPPASPGEKDAALDRASQIVEMDRKGRMRAERVD